MNVLLTNDDGVHAAGLAALRESFVGRGHRVTVVAPDREQSASSHSITLDRPLRIRTFGEALAVDGTPTDCVLVAVHGVLRACPDLVVSGINHGPNMGEDVTYSGTVAAAFEAHILGVPAIAASMSDAAAGDFAGAAHFVADLADELGEWARERRAILNVNFPAGPSAGWGEARITRLGTRRYSDEIIEKSDPRGKKYYWIGGATPTWTGDADTDFAVVHAGGISVTPLHLALTDEAARADLLARRASRIGA
ncbi:MAG: 5'/3'-nucleotidase SurE [Candidatus Eiseniibacteriota bacterium]